MDENQLSDPNYDPPPRRRVRFRLEIDGDSLDMLRASVERALYRLRHGSEFWEEFLEHSHGSMDTSHDPQAPTGIAYSNAIQKWASRQDKGQDKEPAPTEVPELHPKEEALIKATKAANKKPKDAKIQGLIDATKQTALDLPPHERTREAT